MKAYMGTFIKKTGERRKMVFVRLPDLPEGFGFIKNRGENETKPKVYPEGMELVWDLEADNYRVFNYRTAEDFKEIEIEDFT